jgi:hypothetical protein
VPCGARFPKWLKLMVSNRNLVQHGRNFLAKIVEFGADMASDVMYG